MAQSINEVMTHDPRTVDASAPLREVAQAMRDVEAGAVIVMENDAMAGLVTDRDIVVRAVADGADPASTSAGDVCTRGIATLTPDQTVDDAIRLVREQNIRRIPVVQDGRPVGIVSIGDLAIERDEHSALADISSSPSNN